MLYASGRAGWADAELDGPRKDLTRSLTWSWHTCPPRARCCDADEPFRMLATTLSADPFIGRILTGRVESGTLNAGETLKALSRDGEKLEQFRVTKVLAFRGLTQTAIDEAEAGDIVTLAGMTKATVADTLCALEQRHRPARPAH